MAKKKVLWIYPDPILITSDNAPIILSKLIDWTPPIYNTPKHLAAATAMLKAKGFPDRQVTLYNVTFKVGKPLDLTNFLDKNCWPMTSIMYKLIRRELS
jgi:hypothetical protein